MADTQGEVLIVTFLGGGPEDDETDVDEGVRQVNRELSSIGTLRPVPTVSAPEDTRGIDVAAAGAVCAAVAPLLSDLLAAIGEILKWAGARKGRTAKLVRPDGSSIELTSLSANDQHLLVMSWIDAGTSG
jgi:hypothetical protein